MENIDDKWVVCSTPKHGFACNSLIFWGKNDSGHYANLEQCQFYTEKEAKERCDHFSECVAIPVKDLIPYMKTQVVGASAVLRKWQNIQELEELFNEKNIC